MNSEKKLIISLTGAKKSGKSTAGEILSYMFPDAKVTAIAGKLKQACSNAYDLEPIFFESQELKETNLIYPIKTDVLKLCELINSFKVNKKAIKIDSNLLEEFATYKMQNPRHIMQQVGMLIRNLFGSDIHMKHLDLSHDVTIVTDVRFKNEFDWLNKRKDAIHLPLYVKNDLVENSGDLHISEQEYLTFKDKCVTIDNSKLDIMDFSEQIEDVIFSRFS
jgi:hypothetical protein